MTKYNLKEMDLLREYVINVIRKDENVLRTMMENGTTVSECLKEAKILLAEKKKERKDIYKKALEKYRDYVWVYWVSDIEYANTGWRTDRRKISCPREDANKRGIKKNETSWHGERIRKIEIGTSSTEFEAEKVANRMVGSYYISSIDNFIKHCL